MNNNYSGITDFIFLTPDRILVAGFPVDGKQTSPLEKYQKSKDETWKLRTFENPPTTYHPRQIVRTTVFGEDMILISDHGTDKAPFSGGNPLILNLVKDEVVLSPLNQGLRKSFNFNIAAASTSQGNYLITSNVGDSPGLYRLEGDKWVAEQERLPPELQLGQMCMMNTLVHDFDLDGQPEIFLGGCDSEIKKFHQSHDRLLKMKNKNWVFFPEATFPERDSEDQWGTVFTKVVDINEDGRGDILTATHDQGFHRWKVFIYQNVPGDKLSFKKISLNLEQETETEGFVYALENFELTGLANAIFAEVRSVVRSPGKRPSKSSSRLTVQKTLEGSFQDATSCLPSELKELHHAKTFPGNPEKLLLVPYEGSIFTLTSFPFI